MFWELPNCDPETRREQMVLASGGLVPGRAATNLQFVKNTVSVKRNKAKCHKTRYVCGGFLLLLLFQVPNGSSRIEILLPLILLTKTGHGTFCITVKETYF